MPFSINLRPGKAVRRLFTPRKQLRQALQAIFSSASEAAIDAVVDDVLAQLTEEATPPERKK